MKPHAPDPLTPEERELAELSAQLGPNGLPSPALDSRILAAAHAAVQRRPAPRSRPRWPVAMGLAASMVVAVGIAWQLRPLPQVASVSETAESTVAVAAAPIGESDATAEAAPVAMAEDRPGLALDPQPAVAVAEPAPARMAVQVPAPAPRTGAPKPLQRSPSPRLKAQPPRPIAAVAAGAAAPAPPPPAAPAPMSFPETAPADSFAANAAADAAVRQEQVLDAQAASKARAASAKQDHRRVERRAAAPAASAVQERESEALDRVEVTGSRASRTDRQVPVMDDTQLAVDEWLERVRTRYGLGDADAARRSLLLFVRDHPDEAVPDDLEPLLEK